METFLSEVAQRLLADNPQDLDQVTVVFNNRRPGLFLRRELAKQCSKAIFLPKIIGIDELVQAMNPTEITPNEFLLFELYTIHCELEPSPRTFEEFIPLAETMLNDFSAIDLYCVDAQQLFSNLHDIKAIEQWNVHGEKPTEMQLHYLEFYKNLYLYYTKLRERLSEAGKAYLGMAYRKVAESIDTMIERYTCKKTYFVGFNAMSASEERIIKTFVSQGKGVLITDGDAYYYEQQQLEGYPMPLQEAGYFLRKAHQHFDNVGNYAEHYGAGERNITIVSCPENVLQVKYVGNLLQELYNQSTAADMERTAIVLADEQMLIPMLNALPECIPAVNVSMGFPFVNSGTHELILKLIALYQHVKNKRYYYKDVVDLLTDPVMCKALGINRIATAVGRVFSQKKMVYVTLDNIRTAAGEEESEKFEVVAPLFSQYEISVEEMLTLCRSMVERLLTSTIASHDKKEHEALIDAIKIINNIDELQTSHHYIENLATLQKIYLRIAQRHSISFYGEPLSGLQILGMLETRNLDFDRVILVSVNEGTLPAGKKDNTLIPYELKRSQQFHLPSYQEKDAVYAYNFYRLMQRAKEVYLVYHTESKGEPSRFIVQVENELAKKYPNIQLHEASVAIDIHPMKKAAPHNAEKSAAVIQKLLHTEEFSPTALNKFRACSLQFYYENVLNLRQQEDQEEVMQDSDLGTLIHAVLEKIHQGHPNNKLQVELLQAYLPQIRQLLEQEIQGNRDTEGKNNLRLNIAETQIKKFLNSEITALKEGHSIEIVALEEIVAVSLPIEVDGNEIKVTIGGKVDRIDRWDGKLRVIDYKTGNVEDKDLKYKDKEALGSASKEWFQVMLYTWVYCRKKDLKEPIAAGIYPLKKHNCQMIEASWNDATMVGKEQLDTFETLLKGLLVELFHPKIGFVPTFKGNVAPCRYCSFLKDCKLQQ